jgi:alpha-glucosidase
LSDVGIEPSEVRDPRELREPGLALGRDPVRTPMPWDESENAGFTTVKPWLPLNADWPTRNVARMTEDPQSILKLYRRLIELRRNCLALSTGDFVLLSGEGEILAYERRHDSERLLVALNFGATPHRLQLPDWAHGSRLLLSTLDDAPLVEGGAILLRSNEAVVLNAG